MRPPPSPARCLHYPVITAIAALAVAATVQSWLVGNYIDPIFLSDTGSCLREPWRLVTPAFFHGGPLHLIFNVCWLWTFGTLVERRLGHFAALGICLLLAVGSVAAELALFRCGLGLSGVVYGLFGLLWVLSRTDPRFDDAVDEKVVELMIGWFILCIVLKVADVWNVALVSHAAGCVLGALLGWTISADRAAYRLGRGAILLTTFSFCLAGATVAREKVNLVQDFAAINAEQGRAALAAGDSATAIDHYVKATNANENVYYWWDALGAAYQLAGQKDKAHWARDRATRLKNHRARLE